MPDPFTYAYRALAGVAAIRERADISRRRRCEQLFVVRTWCEFKAKFCAPKAFLQFCSRFPRTQSSFITELHATDLRSLRSTWLIEPPRSAVSKSSLASRLSVIKWFCSHSTRVRIVWHIDNHGCQVPATDLLLYL